MLEKDEDISLKNGIWELDCPTMSLYRQETNAIEYTGGGFVKRTKDGKLRFKLLSNQTVNPLIQPHGIAGQIIPDEQYYKLVANDSFGRKWESQHILPDLRGHLDKPGIIISGSLHSIFHSVDLSPQYPERYSYIRMLFFDEITIPYNRSSETIINVDGRDRRRRIDFNVAKYKSYGIDFDMSSNDGIIELLARSGIADLPSNIEIRIVEALQFVLACQLNCSMIEKKSGHIKTFQINESNMQAISARIKPPLLTNPPSIDPNGRIWNIFDKYLVHIMHYAHPKPHPLSNIIFEAIQGSSSSISAQALAVAVAVEGALSVEYPNIACYSEDEKKSINECIDLVQKSSIDKYIKRRLLGAINSWNSAGASAKSKLLSLVKMGIIESHEYKAWKRLRNSFAHASFPTDDLQILLNLSYMVTTLFNKLVFYAIGYKGEYTDYGMHGWPMKMFNHEEIQQEQRISAK